MADLKASNGQYIPLARNQTLSYVPSSYATTPRAGYGDAYKGQSFHDVLNRTQLTSAQLKSMQAPNNARTLVKPATTATAPGVSSSPTFIPNPNSPYNQKLLQETNQHIQNIPPVVPQDEITDQMILNNMQEYANQKAASKTVPAVAAESPLQQVPVGNSPVNSSNSMSSEETNILNAILAKNAINPSSMDTQPVSTTVAPPVSVEITPEIPEIVIPETPARSTLSGFPAYIPAEKITQRTVANPALENTPMLEPMPDKQEPSSSTRVSRARTTEESSELQSVSGKSHQNSGFFNAIGSFFGNIASAVTLGFYRPANDPEPTGFARVIDPFKKAVWDAPKSIIVDAPVGAYHDLNSGEKNATSPSNRSIAMNAETPSSRTIRNFGHSRTSLRRNYYS